MGTPVGAPVRFSQRIRRALYLCSALGLGASGSLFIVGSSRAYASSTSLFLSSTPGFTADAATVPPGICFLDVQALGGAGAPASFGAGEAAGGEGASVEATVAVTPGTEFDVTVAGGGGSEGGGGFGGGGVGEGQGGGGGATAITTSAGVPLVVAGGGGGGGGSISPGAKGGDAGAIGQPGEDGDSLGFLYPGGGGGTVQGDGGRAGEATFSPGSGGGGGGVRDGGAGVPELGAAGGGGALGVGGGGGGGGEKDVQHVNPDSPGPGTAGGAGGTGHGIAASDGGTGSGSGGDGGAGGGDDGFGGGGGGFGFGGGGGADLFGGGGGAGYGGGAGGVDAGGGGGSSFVTAFSVGQSSSVSGTGDGLASVTYDPSVDSCYTATFTSGGPDAVLNPEISLSDAISSTIKEASVVISSGYQTGDTLNFTNQNGISGSYSKGRLNLSGSATVADYATALASVTYSVSPTSGDPTNGGTDTHRTLTWQLSDGVADYAPETSYLNLVSKPGPPLLSAQAGDSVVFLHWVAGPSTPTPSVTQFEILRGTSSGSETPLVTVPTPTSPFFAYDDHTAHDGTTYYYEVEAVNLTGNSPPSNEVAAIPHVQLAAVLHVSTSGDDSSNMCTNPSRPCSGLSWALSEAAPGSTIDLSSGAFSGPVIIDENLSIEGTGEGTTQITGGDAVVTVLSGSVSLSALTITGGTGGPGGGIYNAAGASLRLSDVLVTRNDSSTDDGGIYNAGTMNLANSAVTDNTAAGNCGGIENAVSGILTLSSTVVSGNSSDGHCGGIENENVADIYQSTVTGNSAGTDGGGIWNVGDLYVSGATIGSNNAPTGNGSGIYDGPGGAVTMRGGLVAMNTTSSGDGGGIYVEGGTLNMSGPGGVDGNSAFDGGGIYVSSGSVSLSETTVDRNVAFDAGGGIDLVSGTSQLKFVTVSGNRPDECSGLVC